MLISIYHIPMVFTAKSTGEGKILEVRLEPGAPPGARMELSGRIACPPGLRPAPGQYLLAEALEERRSAPGLSSAGILPAAIFPSGYFPAGFETDGSLPPTWSAGTRLALRGPLGSGFHLAPAYRRVALAALSGSPARLMPLVHQVLERGGDVLLFTNAVSAAVPAGLPLAVEVVPLDQLAEGPAWADYMAVETPLAQLADLRTRLGLGTNPMQRPSCAFEVLVTTPMPCAGQAECGICALPVKNGWRLACKDGPVFAWEDLM
jgi:hypothetical protein